MDDNSFEEKNAINRWYGAYSSWLQRNLDRVTPMHTMRWLVNVLLVVIFMARVILLQGFYIVAYVLGIFLLNQFILFLTPAFVDGLDNDDYDDDDDSGPRLPTSSNEEFRPFMRRLPEFKFWYTSFKSLVISILCTFFSVLDIPVFWPILVMYFITLFIVTMKRQIRHMIKHRYLPFSHGKTKYQGKPEIKTSNK
jgi:hypothetical protein